MGTGTVLRQLRQREVVQVPERRFLKVELLIPGTYGSCPTYRGGRFTRKLSKYTAWESSCPVIEHVGGRGCDVIR
ncbi:hypothetical protein RhoFasSB10_03157 [Rhodococcus fascians]|nr:hypothetical protein [Rhodococcus fascians]